MLPTLPTRDGYDRWAAVYDGDGNPLRELEEPRVADLLGDVRSLRALDVGCGTGRHALRLARAGAEVTAVDFSEGMLARARTKPGAEKVRFVVHDLANGGPMPLDDASFDVVLSCLVADHLPDLEAYFRDLGRVARRGGRVLVTTLHPAMNLRGVRARFRDPATDEKVEIESIEHTTSAYVTALLRAGLTLVRMEEHAPDEQLARTCPRAVDYLGWPMLLLFDLARPS